MKNNNLSKDQNQTTPHVIRPPGAGRSSLNEIAAAPPADEGSGGAYFSQVNMGSLQRHKVEHWLPELIAERNISRVQGFRHHR